MPAPTHAPVQPRPPVVYPESDGEPMAENTLQYRWITLLIENLRACFPQDFVAGDLFWYPREGHPEVRSAPDVLVALGRPAGERASYRQWEEGGVAPQVVMEVWSPSNDFGDMMRRWRFFRDHGVREFYAYDPERNLFTGHVRRGDDLEPVAVADGWTSPLLGVRFEPGTPELRVYRPDGTPFRSYAELEAAAASAQAAAAEATARAEALAARLRALGIDPDAG